MSYEYTDFDGDRLIIENTDWPARTASVSVHGNAVFVPAAEAPKAAQAILDAAGVKGVVIVGSNINVTLSDTVDSIETKLKAHEEAAAEKAHDDLRTSPIALKALALYNKECIGYGPYESWDATNSGNGASDLRVKEYIELAEQEEAKEKEAAEKLAARRDDVTSDLAGIQVTYASRSKVIQRAVCRIIALEDKAA